MQALITAKEKLTEQAHVRENYRREGTDVTAFTRFTLFSAVEYGAVVNGENVTEAYQLVRDELPLWTGGMLSMFNERATLAQIHKVLDRAIVNCFA